MRLAPRGGGVHVRRAPDAAVDVLVARRCAPAGRPTGRCTTPAPPRATVAAGAPGAPNTTRRPRARSTQATAGDRPKRSPWRAMRARRSSSVPGGAAMRASAAARTSAPPRARATAPAARASCRRCPRAGAEPAGAPRSRPPPSASAAAARRGSRAAASSASRRRAPLRPRPAPRLHAREQVGGDIEPAEVPTICSQAAKSMPVSAATPASTPPIQAAPIVPPAPRTSTSGRCIRADGSAARSRIRLYVITYART